VSVPVPNFVFADTPLSVVTKKGKPSESIHVGIFDDTGEATLTLWGSATSSVSDWEPSKTILLIANPRWKIDRKTWLSLNANTRVDIDPAFNDAVWLRAFAQRLTKKDHVNPPFPERRMYIDGPCTCNLNTDCGVFSVFDIEAAESSEVRILYTLADIDELYVSRRE